MHLLAHISVEMERNKSMLLDVIDISELKKRSALNQPKNEQLRGVALKKRIIQNLGDLPAMPHIVSRAQEIISDSNADFTDFEQAVETDQAIVMRVLKLANSAKYGQTKRVTSIKRAAVVLGFQTLGELVILAGTSNLLDKPLKGYFLRTGDLWRHSLATAFCARAIANKRTHELTNDAFIAGLIHDAGKLILDPYILERKPTFNKYIGDKKKGLSRAEKMTLGFDHAEIAALVCERWNLPKHIHKAIQYHHNPTKIGKDKLTYIVYLSNQIAKSIGENIEAITLELDETAMRILDIWEEDIEHIVDEVTDSINQIIDELKD